MGFYVKKFSLASSILITKNFKEGILDQTYED